MPCTPCCSQNEVLNLQARLSAMSSDGDHSSDALSAARARIRELEQETGSLRRQVAAQREKAAM
jgi:hypothetical protein